ncbi:hypothetical protein WA1_30880 [Scytonema hofmannii PCC 7110]|uniref:Uncharacterized protein n=1 Tax=Scytonema hofmannii PCC 7110 TaxID=128403 RepID=A0A139X4Y0_9CYAN|nr:pentapeptide repeat-containing protein [Scytonema hofmannii]KYC39734.1 hypothetical protein WA1_30880 [Scytonema hofmannii PCC 7110]
MSLSFRHWLAEHDIEIPHISQFSSGQIVGLAFRIVQDMELKSLSIFDICPLVEVLEMPLGAVLLEISVFAQLTQNLVTVFSQKKSLKRTEGTWLAFQIAYLRALHQVLSQEKNLHRPWIDRVMIWNRQTRGQREQGEFPPSPPPPISPSSYRPLLDAQLQGLLKTLRPGKLTDTQAEQALSVVADSLLVQQMNNASVAWLLANSAEEAEAKLIVQRLVNGLAGHLLAAIAENAPPFAQLQKFFRLGSSLLPNSTPSASAAGDKIDLYRELYRASLIQSYSEPLFVESFALKDIYVSPKGLPVEKNDSQQVPKASQLVDLMMWAQQQLSDLETVALIESEAGYGKSSFCRIWAGILAQEVYPHWMPVLINLSEVTPCETLEETLNSGFRGNFHVNLSEWLELSHPRCLLILDGLDELPPSYLGKRAKSIFIQQLLDFQSKRQHKVFLTSRSEILQEIAQELPSQLRRITIACWEQDELRQWFQQWTKVQSLPIAQNFFTFLKQAGIFSTRSELQKLSAFVRQPLMLYLLGILHREELLDDEMLQLAAKAQYRGNASLLWEIYYRLSKWLLGYPQAEGIKTVQMRWGSSHIHRTQEAIANLLQGYHPQELLEIMQDKALRILHSGRSQISLTDELDILPAFYFKRGEGRKDFSCLISTLQNPKSKIQNPKSKIQNSLEFTHSKLGDYFCAKAIIAGLKRLVERTPSAYGEPTFVLDSRSEIALHLYKLLGYGALSQEIETLVIEGLRRLNKRECSFELLCERLLPFWYAYCQGHWLNEDIGHKALSYFQVLQNPVNLEQVNAAVGLNIFLLLFSSHQEAKIPFLPCGNPASLTEFNSEALTWLIGRTSILGKNTLIFRLRSKSFSFINLSGVHLEEVMLAGFNFEQVNLSNAELVGANLAAANFQDANLAGADLSNTNLENANFMGADLTGANLTGVNLESVNLTNACLFQAVLTDAIKEIALSKGAIFSSEQFQIIKNFLSQQSQLNIISSTDNTAVWTNNNMLEKGIIESIEGELILSEESYDISDQ